METKEILFSQDSNRFDTRKVLNRAANTTINPEILETIETEGLTSEILDRLNIPVFKYHTQITLHGIFDIDINTRIGGYKNLLLNQNKSLGIKYNAIDYLKKKQIAKYLKLYGFYFQRNSTGDLFIYSTGKKELALEIYNKIDVSAFYAKKHVMALNCYGMITYYVTVNLMAIYEAEIINFAIAVTGSNGTELQAKIEAKEQEDKLQAEKWEQEKIKDQAEREAKEKILNEQAAPMRAQISHLQECNDPSLGILVKVILKQSTFRDPEPDSLKFCFYRINGKGSFGRVKIQKAYSDTFEVNNLTWIDQKELKPVEIRLKGFKLIPTVKTYKPTSPEPCKNENTPVNGSLRLVYYSDKALAIVGDTKPVKDKLMSLGGRFNPFLTVDNQKTAGWIFPATKKETLQKSFSL